jgi:hypothetical protein
MAIKMAALVWLPLSRAVVDRSCWQSLDVDFVLLWRTAERIDSPQCIAYTFTLAPAVCVCVCTHWAPYGVYT